MTRWAISSGSRFETLAGYSRAVVDGEVDLRIGHGWLRYQQQHDIRRRRRAGPPISGDYCRSPRPRPTRHSAISSGCASTWRIARTSWRCRKFSRKPFAIRGQPTRRLFAASLCQK